MKFVLIFICLLSSIFSSNLQIQKNLFSTLSSTKGDDPFKMYLVNSVSFTPESKISDLTLKKKIYATTIYETWEVTRFEKDRIKPYIAHLFKYTLQGTFPLKAKDINAWCLKIFEVNSQMRKRLLDIRSPPCIENKAFNQVTPTGLFTYVLFNFPDGGIKMEEACTESCVKERICRYSIKNLARGLLRLFQSTSETANKYDLNYLLVKGAFFFGKTPSASKVQLSEKENYDPIVKASKAISGAGLDQDEIPFKNHFLVIPFFKFAKPEDLETVSTLEKQEIRDNQAKIQMVTLGQFLVNLYKGFREAAEVKIILPGDNFEPDQNLANMDMADLYLIYNSKDIKSGEIYPDSYFGVSQEFSSLIGDASSGKISIKKAKMNSYLLKGSYYEFIFKLQNFLGDQFNSYDEALKHKFLTGQVFINQIGSDTGNMNK